MRIWRECSLSSMTSAGGFALEDRRETLAVIGISEPHAQLALDAFVLHPLVVGVEAARHVAELRLRERHQGRRRDIEQRGRVVDDLGRRCRIVVADIVDSTRIGVGDRSGKDLRDIVDMDAAEYLAWLVDTLGPARTQAVEGGTSRPIDPGQAEDMHGQSMFSPEIEPAGFGRNPAAAAFARGRKLALFIDPAAGAIAVDAGGREITRPGKMLERSDLCAMARQHRIAASLRRHRAQEMRGTREDRAGIRERCSAVKEVRLNAARCELSSLLLRAAGGNDAPIRTQ